MYGLSSEAMGSLSDEYLIPWSLLIDQVDLYKTSVALHVLSCLKLRVYQALASIAGSNRCE